MKNLPAGQWRFPSFFICCLFSTGICSNRWRSFQQRTYCSILPNLRFALSFLCMSFSEKSWARFSFATFPLLRPLACQLRHPKFYVRILVEFLLACFTLFVRTSENYWAVEVRFSEKKVRNASQVPWIWLSSVAVRMLGLWSQCRWFDSRYQIVI